MHLYAGGLSSCIDGNRHGVVLRYSLASDGDADAGQASVFEFHAAVREISNRLRMGHHQNRVPRGMQFAQQLQDDGLVRLIEIAGGLVGQNQLRLIDQRARDGHALLLAAGKLRGNMVQAVAQAHARAALPRPLFHP